MTTVLVTGAAGFIGFHCTNRLLDGGYTVVGVDDLNAYYDVKLKEARLALLQQREGFSFTRLDIGDAAALKSVFDSNNIELVLHLAAQAGVRYSLTHPEAYVQANLVGFGNILERCRHGNVKHLAYASSSSVYGANTKLPFSVRDNVDHPVSFYAATKKANELMAHTYSHLYSLPTTGLRFFTVYGPWGRPDMAMFIFTRAILAGEPIKLFNYGQMRRDFTYIDDIVEGVVRVLENVATPEPDWNSSKPDPGRSSAPYRVYNIGNNSPVELPKLISTLEHALGRTAVLEPHPLQPGDVPATFADVEDLVRDVGFRPATPIEVGVERFVKWYRDFYR